MYRTVHLAEARDSNANTSIQLDTLARRGKTSETSQAYYRHTSESCGDVDTRLESKNLRCRVLRGFARIESELNDQVTKRTRYGASRKRAHLCLSAFSDDDHVLSSLR